MAITEGAIIIREDSDMKEADGEKGKKKER